jgi:RNA polymerase sigma-70 factor (ECF subfamily)
MEANDTITQPTNERRPAVELLFEAMGADLWRALLVFTGGRTTVAEDAVAEAFTRAIEHWNEIKDPRAWLYRVAFRIASAELQRERRPGPNDAESGEVVGVEDVMTVLEALKGLPPNQRSAIFLHYRMDMSVRDIATVLGISAATTKVHLHRGRNRLRPMLGTEEPTDA